MPDLSIFMKAAKDFNGPFLLRRIIACGLKPTSNLMFGLKDTNHLIGSRSSACPEITTLADDIHLLNQGRSELAKINLPDRLEGQEAELLAMGDDMAEQEVSQAVTSLGRAVRAYFQAFQGFFDPDAKGQKGQW